MAKSIQQVVMEHMKIIRTLTTEMAVLQKEVSKLKLDAAQPKTEKGRQLPPTRLPEGLKRLELGRDPLQGGN
jgi:hypothetical protein